VGENQQSLAHANKFLLWAYTSIPLEGGKNCD